MGLALLAPAAATGAALESGVRGTVTIGPTAPVCEPGVACARPFSTRITIRKATTGKRVASVRSDSHGHFRARLPAGRYRLYPRGGSPFPRCAPATVRVRAQRFTRVALRCDTGIR